MSLELELARLGRQIGKTADQVSPNPVQSHQGTVISADPEAGTAVVQIGEGEFGAQVQIQQQAGFLPMVGDKVLVQMHGNEPIVLAPRQLVDGDIQSKDFSTGVSGWKIDAAGNAEFNDVDVRGYVNNIKVNAPPLCLVGSNYDQAINNNTLTTVALSDWTTIVSNSGGVIGDAAYDVGPVSGFASRIQPGRVGLWKITVNIGWKYEANSQLGDRKLEMVADYSNDPTWSSLVTYHADDHVIRSGVHYVALITGLNHPPESSPTYWDTVAYVEVLDFVDAAVNGLTFHNYTGAVIVGDVNTVYNLRVLQNSGHTMHIQKARWLWEFLSD